MFKLINKRILDFKNDKHILKKYFNIWNSKTPENLEETIVNKITNKRIISLVKEKIDEKEDKIKNDNKENKNQDDEKLEEIKRIYNHK